jgi:hypothetical protein
MEDRSVTEFDRIDLIHAQGTLNAFGRMLPKVADMAGLKAG